MKTHTFPWILIEDWRWKWRFLEWKWRFWEREREVEKTKRKARDVMETKKFWKTVWVLTLFVQNMWFLWLNWLASKSLNWVAKIPWTQILENYSNSFSRLGLPLTNESRMPLDELAICKLLLVKESWTILGKLVSESPKGRVENFLYFLKIFKIEHFPKTAKILKNLFWVWSTYVWVCTSHLIKYNHTNE